MCENDTNTYVLLLTELHSILMNKKKKKIVKKR